MYSHDRTQLTQRLGFQDPDKRNPAHDRACQYMGTPEAAKALFNLFDWNNQSYWLPRHGYDHNNKCLVFDDIIGFNAVFECPINKGHAQYKSTMGFIDAVIDITLALKHRPDASMLKTRTGSDHSCSHHPAFQMAPHLCCSACGGHNDSENSDVRVRLAQICVEVKIAEEPAANVLRQVNFYREYWPGARWVVATAYGFTDVDKAMLHSADIRWVRLGDKFRAFMETCAKGPATPQLEL